MACNGAYDFNLRIQLCSASPLENKPQKSHPQGFRVKGVAHFVARVWNKSSVTKHSSAKQGLVASAPLESLEFSNLFSFQELSLRVYVEVHVYLVQLYS